MTEEGEVQLGVHAAEALAQKIILVLRAVDGIADQLGAGAGEGVAIEGDGLVEEAGEEGGFQAPEAIDGVLGEGDAFDGMALLGVDGPVAGHGSGGEFGDGFKVFDADDGECLRAEAVFTGVESGTRLAFGGTRTGGALGVAAIGGELLIRECLGGIRQHESALLIRGIARRQGVSSGEKREVAGKKGD